MSGMTILPWNPFKKLLTIDLLNVVLPAKLKGWEFNEFDYIECNFIVLHL
jgi:hypothetical protein